MLLKELCKEHGIQDSLKVWHGILIDGYNRYEISKELDLSYKIEEMDFPDREAVKAWIAKNQLGRRNLDDLTKIKLVRIARSEIEKEAKKRTADGNANGGKSAKNSLSTKKKRVRRDVKIPHYINLQKPQV